jgi:hypothetical protein
MPFFIIIFYLIFFAIAILGAIFWIWMIIDCATNEPSEGNDKVIWILVVVLASWVGAAIYYFVRRPERIKKFGK